MRDIQNRRALHVSHSTGQDGVQALLIIYSFGFHSPTMLKHSTWHYLLIDRLLVYTIYGLLQLISWPTTVIDVMTFSKLLQLFLNFMISMSSKLGTKVNMH